MYFPYMFFLNNPKMMFYVKIGQCTNSPDTNFPFAYPMLIPSLQITVFYYSK